MLAWLFPCSLPVSYLCPVSKIRLQALEMEELILTLGLGSQESCQEFTNAQFENEQRHRFPGRRRTSAFIEHLNSFLFPSVVLNPVFPGDHMEVIPQGPCKLLGTSTRTFAW